MYSNFEIREKLDLIKEILKDIRIEVPEQFVIYLMTNFTCNQLRSLSKITLTGILYQKIFDEFNKKEAAKEKIYDWR